MDREQLTAWVAEGRSLEWIGARVGRHPSTVAYWVAKFGLQAAHRERHAPRGRLDRDVLEELVGRDLSIAEIASTVGRSKTTVRHWLAFHGLQTTRAARRKHAPAGDALRVCRRHGPARHTLRPDGGARCCRCNSEAVSRRRREVKRRLVAEAGGACAICGYDRWLGALQFHHVDPAQKRFPSGTQGAGPSARYCP
jgi:transposase